MFCYRSQKITKSTSVGVCQKLQLSSRGKKHHVTTGSLLNPLLTNQTSSYHSRSPSTMNKGEEGCTHCLPTWVSMGQGVSSVQMPGWRARCYDT